MKPITGTIFALAAAAAGAMASPMAPVAAAPIEQLLVNDFVRDSRSGQTKVQFSLLDHSITCVSGAVEAIPSERFTCTEHAYTFSVLASPRDNAWTMEIQHTLEDGTELAGSFYAGCNGPLPTLCFQIGTANLALVKRE